MEKDKKDAEVHNREQFSEKLLTSDPRIDKELVPGYNSVYMDKEADLIVEERPKTWTLWLANQ